MTAEPTFLFTSGAFDWHLVILCRPWGAAAVFSGTWDCFDHVDDDNVPICGLDRQQNRLPGS
jgi:hypothetical protein